MPLSDSANLCVDDTKESGKALIDKISDGLKSFKKIDFRYSNAVKLLIAIAAIVIIYFMLPRYKNIESNYEAGSRPYGSSADGLRACK